mgnify:CR=1 FL=1
MDQINARALQVIERVQQKLTGAFAVTSLRKTADRLLDQVATSSRRSSSRSRIKSTSLLRKRRRSRTSRSALLDGVLSVSLAGCGFATSC